MYASLASPRQVPKLIYIPHIDKIVHLIMYFGFCFLGLWVMNTGLNGKNISAKDKNGLINYLFVSILAVGWGFLMEIMQRIIATGRDYSVYDLLANVAGALLGSILYFLLVRKHRLRA